MGTIIKLTLGTWRQEITSSDWRLAYIDEESGYAWIADITTDSSNINYMTSNISKFIPKNRINIIGKCKIKRDCLTSDKSLYAKTFLAEIIHWPLITAEELDKKWKDQFCNHDLTDYYPYII